MSNSNSTGPQVGLGDKDFDSSLYSQEVDFDFFDESGSSAPPTRLQKPSDTTAHHESESEPRRGCSPVPMEPPPMFSTESLMASISSLSSSDECGNPDDGIAEEPMHSVDKTNNRPRVRLFDISDTSSDEEEESQPHMSNLTTAYLLQHNAAEDSIDEDNYLTDDSNLSDITDVTPISSLACSPMPSPCAPDHHDDEEDEEELGNSWDDYKDEDDGKNEGSSGLEMRGCNQPLGPLHLDILELGGGGPSFLGETANMGEKTNMNGISPLPDPLASQYHQQLLELAESHHTIPMLSYRGTLADGVDKRILGGVPPPFSSSSSETGSGGCGSSSSMSIPSGGTTMSVSGSSTSLKVFGHMRHTPSSSTGNKSKVKNHSFTKDESKRIERDNQILMKKIAETQKRKHHINHHGTGVSGAGGSGIHHLRVKQHPAHNARLKQQKRIDYENSILVQKLQSVKPSQEIRYAFPGVSSPPVRGNPLGNH